MSVEVTIICDDCGAAMAGAKTAREAREDARHAFRARTLPGGIDVCGDCLGARQDRKAAGQ